MAGAADLPDFSGLSDVSDGGSDRGPPPLLESSDDGLWQGAELMSFDSDTDGEQVQLQQVARVDRDVHQGSMATAARQGRRGRPPGQHGRGGVAGLARRGRRGRPPGRQSGQGGDDEEGTQGETPEQKRQRVSQVRRAAAQARWAKAAAPTAAATTAAAATATTAAALDPSTCIAVSSFDIQEPTFLELIAYKPPAPVAEEPESQIDDEINTWNLFSKKGNAQDSGLPSRRTAKRRLHSFAGSARILQSTRTSMTLAAYDRHLRDLHGDANVHSLVSVLSVQHDESSFKMNIKKDDLAEEKDTAIAKVLQIRASLTCVWELLVGGKLQHVRATTSPMLAHSLIERNTADCIKQALDEHVSIPAWIRESFATHVRCTLDDSHSANIKTQAAYVRDASRSGSMNNTCMRGPCDSHFAFGILKRVQACLEFDISGMVNFGLSLNFTGAMIEFRNAVRSIIRDRVRLCRGSPPAEVTLHNRRVFDSFMRYHTEDFNSSRCMTRRRVLLLRIAARKLFTGNLRCEDTIEHYCHCVPPCRDREHTVERMDQCVVTPFFRRVATLDRKSWAGVGDVVQWHCFWQSLHGIGRLAFF